MANNVQELIDERNTLLHELLEARERLAAVEAACSDAEYDPAVPLAFIADVLAAARGEGDRPAESTPCCDRWDAEFDAIHSGEGDRG